MTQSPLRFLPEGKRAELAFIVDVIRSGFAHATARRTQLELQGGSLLKIVLFGSYARGDWVEDPVGRYFSDYDLLVIVNQAAFTDWAEFWEKIDRRLIDAAAAGTHLRTPHSLVIDTLETVNEQLRLGRYFFIDIVRDGIILFEEPGHFFAAPQPLTPSQALVETQTYFDKWNESTHQFLRTFEFSRGDGAPNVAAFLLHQSAERAYHCLFLVLTLYSPKTHQLSKLRRMAEDLDPRLKSVWPNASKFERRAYALLNEAYIKARYSPQYEITPVQLDWLGERVRGMIAVIETICRERLATLQDAA